MDEKPFVINDQFSVDPVRGWVRHDPSGHESRLEPRLMRLLCLLVASREKLLTREVLTKEVWDDYGNADESLTQAISYLRKLFNDEAKGLIETVPKKGYIFHAVINPVLSARDADKPIKTKKKQRVFITVLLILLSLAAGYYLLRGRQNRSPFTPDVNSDLLRDSAKHKSGDGATADQPTVNPDKIPDTTKKAANADALKK